MMLVARIDFDSPLEQQKGRPSIWFSIAGMKYNGTQFGKNKESD